MVMQKNPSIQAHQICNYLHLGGQIHYYEFAFFYLCIKLFFFLTRNVVKIQLQKFNLFDFFVLFSAPFMLHVSKRHQHPQPCRFLRSSAVHCPFSFTQRKRKEAATFNFQVVKCSISFWNQHCTYEMLFIMYLYLFFPSKFALNVTCTDNYPKFI